MPKKHTPPALDVRKYRGQYVMLHPTTNAVVGHGKTIEEARKGAEERGIDRPILYPVPKSDAYFVGGSYLYTAAG